VELWRDVPARLSAATNCGALVYSRLGYGRSDACPLPRPIRFMHDEGLKVLPQVIRAAKIRKAIIVGHSDGGSIGIVYAGGKQDSNLLGLITMAAHVFCEELSVASIQAAKKDYEKGDLRRRLKKYHGRNVDCAFRGWNDVWLDPDFMQWNIEEYLPGIRVPMLAIQGDKDQYGTKAQIEAIREKAGSGAEIVMLPNCRHSPHLEKGKEVLAVMGSYVNSIVSAIP
jgi:pimeloyl-ACP methyl ester carboxylesterase